jgi:CDP-diglyceride synthetase
MPVRFVHIFVQGSLVLSGFIAFSIFSTIIVNWKDWIALIIAPYVIAFVGNCMLGALNKKERLPTHCIWTSLLVCSLAWTFYLALVTNPFHLRFTLMSLFVPVVVLVMTILSYSAVMLGVIRNKNG